MCCRRDGSLTTLQCIRQVYRQEGIRGFYRGLTASYYGIVETVIHFVIYERLRAKLVELRARRRPRDSETSAAGRARDFLEYTAAAGTSKGIATCVGYPHGKSLSTEFRNTSPRYTSASGSSLLEFVHFINFVIIIIIKGCMLIAVKEYGVALRIGTCESFFCVRIESRIESAVRFDFESNFRIKSAVYTIYIPYIPYIPYIFNPFHRYLLCICHEREWCTQLSTCYSFQFSPKTRQTMPLHDYLTPKLDFKRKFNHHQSFLYKGRLTGRTIRKFRIGSSLRIESWIGSSIRNRIESPSFAGP